MGVELAETRIGSRSYWLVTRTGSQLVPSILSLFTWCPIDMREFDVAGPFESVEKTRAWEAWLAENRPAEGDMTFTEAQRTEADWRAHFEEWWQLQDPAGS